MLVNGHGRGQFGTVEGVSEDICLVSGEQVEDGSFLPALDDQILEVEHLLGGTKDDKILVGGVLCMDSEKFLAIEDFPCPVDYCEIENGGGGLDSDTTPEGKPEMNSKFEFLDDMLQGVEEENLHVTTGLSSDCADYLLDTRFAGGISHLDYDREGSSFENLSSECGYPTLTQRDDGVAELSNLTSVTNPLLDASSNQGAICLDNLTIRELHETFKSTLGRETSVKDKQWLKRRISFGLHSIFEWESASELLERQQLSPAEIEDDILFKSSGDSPGRFYNSFANIHGNMGLLEGNGTERESFTGKEAITTGLTEGSKLEFGLSNVGDREGVNRKRLRKPTRRYIEESSEMKSRFIGSGRLETPTKGSRDKFFRVKSHNHHYWKGFEGMTLVCRQDSLGGSGIQVPFVLRVRRGRPRKNCTSLMVHDSKESKEHMLLSVVPKKFCGLEPSQAESQDEISDGCVGASRTAKGGIRRKHHRLWTLSEVLKLVEGVSRYGVGRWSDIKKLEFSSSVYRTSVDLKDKWRNLLRASYAQLQTKKEVEHRRKHASVPIPASILVRVRELAGMYPKEQQSVSHLHSAPSSVTDATNTSISRSGRIVHRRHFV